MFKKIVVFFGLAAFIFSLSLIFIVDSAEKKAKLQDDSKKIFAIVSEDTPPSCKWEVKTPERVMSENTSQAIVVTTSNSEKKQCETYLSISAPSFDIEPTKNEQKINLAPGKEGSISWIISPRKTGSYNLALSDIINTKIYGISITNMFGLNAFQAKIASIIGSLFGPMFTIPWWWDRLKKRKSEKT